MVKSVVAQRINLVVTELIDYASQQEDSPFQAHLWLVKALFTSIGEELDDANDEVLAHWMGQFGNMMEWCASGDDSVLSPDVLAYLKRHHQGILAIEAGK